MKRRKGEVSRIEKESREWKRRERDRKEKKNKTK